MTARICAWPPISTECTSGRMICLPSRCAGSSGRSAGLGVSTHNPEQLREADQTSADYLAIGPVFATSSKDKPDPVVGLEGVRRARAVDPQAAGGDWRDYAGECRFRDRGWGGFGGGDIRPVTGAPQISRGIFPHLEVKSGIGSCFGVARRARARSPSRLDDAPAQTTND